MQVACNSCGAQYEFDASAIPAEGYDAQCTSCSAIFFVAPEPSQVTAAPVGGEAPQVTVSCSHCGAMYQFAASDIPAGGYDAQCTQCQGVFFVSPQGAAPTVSSGFEGAHTSPALDYNAYTQTTQSDMPVSQTKTAEFYQDHTPVGIPAFSPRPLAQGTMEIQAPPQGEDDFDEVSGVVQITGNTGQFQNPLQQQQTQDDYADNSDDMDAEAPDYSEPGPPVRGWTTSSRAALAAADIDQEDDPGTKGRAMPLFFAVATVLLATVFGGLSYKYGPAMLQRWRQPPPKPPSEAAVAAFQRGQRAMLEDTEAAYQTAIAAFTEAVNMAPEYADALTWGAVAQMLLGEDRMEAGRTSWKEAKEKQTEAKVLAANVPQGRVRPRDLADYTTRLQAMQRTALQTQQKATEMLEAGGKTLSEGAVMLLRARRVLGDRPAIAEAEAIWYVSLPAGVGAATQELKHAETLRNDPLFRQTQGTSPTPWWAVVVQARLDAAEPATYSQAVATLQALVSKSPQAVRARWELAELLARTDQTKEARDLAQAIVEETPTHAKAQALLAKLSAAPEGKPAAAAAEPTEPEAPQKPGKAKRKRAKHR